jgi:hypothetical protein
MEIDFKTSNLKATIITVNDIEALKRYKKASEGSIMYWNKEKDNNHPRADLNIEFFTQALNLCDEKILKASKQL